MCHTGPYTVPTAQLSLCHHPFPGHGKCQGRDGVCGAGWGAHCAHPSLLQSANPPHSPHVLPWWPSPRAHPTSHSTTSAQPPQARASSQGHRQGRQPPTPLSTAFSWFGFTLTAMLQCPLHLGSPLQEKMQMDQSSALLKSQVWGSELSAIPSWSSPGSSPKRANPGEGLQGHHRWCLCERDACWAPWQLHHSHV